MDIHPDSVQHNFVSQFPEIFGKYEPLRFQFGDVDKMETFYDTSSYLFGSQGNKDVGMIFSAVERSYIKRPYQRFEDYIRGKKVLTKLLGIWWPPKLRKRLDELVEQYREEYGQKRNILKFYTEYLQPEDKKLLISKMFLPPQLSKGTDEDSLVRTRIDLLLEFRHGQAHSAKYTAFSDGTQRKRHEKAGNTWFMTLSFEEFYEMTRKALARFWAGEYERYLASGGKEKIDALIQSLEEQKKAIAKSVQDQEVKEATK